MKSVEMSDAGTNPLWPTSTTKPPLTTSVTLASITSSLSFLVNIHMIFGFKLTF